MRSSGRRLLQLAAPRLSGAGWCARGLHSAGHTANAAHSWPGRAGLALVGSAAAAAGVYIATSERPAASSRVVLHFPVRLLRDVYAAGLTILDYKARLLPSSRCLLRHAGLVSLLAASVLAVASTRAQLGCACSGR